MKLNFLFYGSWDVYPNSDRCQQQVRLAVLVARIRGTVRSGVCACLRALREKECPRPLLHRSVFTPT